MNAHTDFRAVAAGSYDIPAEVYHADPAPEPSLSSTLARQLLGASPLHAWAKSPRLNPEHVSEDKDAFNLGRAAHTSILGKGQPFTASGFDNFRTKAAREEREDLEAKGFTVLNPEQFTNLAMMTGAARFQMERHGIGDVFTRGQIERSHFAQIDGVWCRCMTDCLIEDGQIVYDYKTTAGSAAPDAVIRTICNYGYDVQAAHYLDVVKAVMGGDWRFRLIVQEKSDPFALSVVEIGADWLITARKKAARARELWRLCLDRYGESPWPGYPAQVAVLSEPTWHESKWLDREAFEAGYRETHGQDVLAAGMAWQAPV